MLNNLPQHSIGHGGNYARFSAGFLALGAIAIADEYWVLAPVAYQRQIANYGVDWVSQALA